MKLIAKSLADLPQIAKQVIEFAQQEKIWVLNGQMGAGKTTFSKVLCRELGVEENVSSPTFSIVNEYLSTTGQSIYHFDFYRLKDAYEALDIGVEEYFDSGNICLLEWASKIEQLHPDSFLLISITAQADGTRLIELSHEVD